MYVKKVGNCTPTGENFNHLRTLANNWNLTEQAELNGYTEGGTSKAFAIVQPFEGSGIKPLSMN